MHQAGKRLGPYQIVSVVGQGGMGVVYRAKDTRLGRDVAIKVLDERFSGNRDLLSRFEQEARSTGALNHPNIVSVFDVGDTGGQLYVVTELLQGQTLRQALALGALTGRKLFACAQQIAARDRRRPCAGDRPSRPEAREHLPHPRRQREDPGFRHRETRGNRGGGGRFRNRDLDPARRGPGDAGLHVARAGSRRAGRCALRYLLLRVGAVRDVHRQARVRIRDGRGDDDRHPAAGAAARNAGESRTCRRPWTMWCAAASRSAAKTAFNRRAIWPSW